MTTTETIKSGPASKGNGFTYEGALQDALKIHWKVEDVLAPNETLDFRRPFLPESLAGTQSIAVLSPAEQLHLNHIRGKTYLYLFGFVEEFILPFVLDQARESVHGSNARTRSLLTFAEEEAKHIDLFRRFDQELDRHLATKVELIGPAEAVAQQVLAHGRLGIALTILHLEWLTQRHYLESVKTDESIDPKFASLLRHHWQEEAQHAKLDTLLVHELASKASPSEIERGFDDYLKIAGILDGGLVAQVDHDADALERLAKRKFSPPDRVGIVAAQVRSYRHTFLVLGARHPNFVETLRSLSESGARRVEKVVETLAS